MSLISRLKSHQLKPRVYLGFYNSSFRSPFHFIKHFSSTFSTDDETLKKPKETPENDVGLTSFDDATLKNPEENPVIDGETLKKPQETPENDVGLASFDDATLKNPEENPVIDGETLKKPEETPKVDASNVEPQKVRTRGGRISAEKLEDTVCRMMSRRAWTTRLQNSIRSIVPKFDELFVLGVLENARNADHALQFFRWVERSHLFKHTRDTHLKIIEILGRAKMLNHARCIFLDMESKGVKWDEELFVAMIISYGTAGIVQESVKFFDKMKDLGVERGVASYDALFRVIMRRGRFFMAKRYFNRMIAEGVAPTKHTFHLLLWGFFLCKEESTAIRFYEDMKSRGILPDVVTYNTLINGFFRLSKVEESEKLFVEMKGKNIAPNVISYTTMIKGYILSEKVDDAYRMYEEMKGFHIKPNAVTFSTLLPGLCDAMKMSEAHTVFKEMVARRISPKDNSIFFKLLRCQCEAGDLNAAAGVLKGMGKLNIPTEAGHYGTLIEKFCKAEEYGRVMNLLDKLIEKEIVLIPQSTLEMEPSSYNAVIEYLCNNGKTEKAETLFRQLMKRGVLDPAAFNNLIRGHSKEGNPEAAFEMHKIMIKRGVSSEADAYGLLINSFLEKGEPADAKVVLDSMIENGHSPDSALFRTVMEGLFKDERVQTASRVMKTMLEKGVTDNMDLASDILKALLMRGHVEEALGRIELLTKSGCPVEVDSAFSVLCEKGKTSAAFKLLEYVLESGLTFDFSSCDKVLDCLLAAGKTLNAYSLLCKISRMGFVTEKKHVEDLIEKLIEEGNTKQADVIGRLTKGEKAIIPSRGKKKPSQELVL